MITIQGAAASPSVGATRAARDITEAFEAARGGLPALRDALSAGTGEGEQGQILSRDIKLTLSTMLADAKRAPSTSDEAFRLALGVAAAAASLGALDGVVTYVGRLLPLRVTDEEAQAPAVRRIVRTLESTGDEVLAGAEHVCRAEGTEHVRTMSRVTKTIAGRQLDDLRARWERAPDPEAWQRATVELMMTAYTAGILDACEVCVSP